MHAGQNTHMKRGAIAACVLPMGLGLLGLILIGLDSPFTYDNPYFSNSPHFMTLPIALCFFFGTPLAAWLACRRLRKITSIEKIRLWRTSAWRGLVCASAVQFVACVFYTFLSGKFFIYRPNEFERTGDELFSLLFMSGFINAGLWVILTLPFSLLCATIFWRVTKFPDDTSVF